MMLSWHSPVCAQVDEIVTWSWPVVFAPVLVFSSLITCCACYACVQAPPSDPAEQEHSKISELWERFRHLLTALCVLSFLGVLSVWLNGDLPGVSLGAVFVPIFLYEFLALLDLPKECSQKTFDGIKEQLGAAFPYNSRAEYSVNVLVQQVLRIAQWILLVLKNDVESMRGSSFSWWAVFAPCWAGIFWFKARAMLRVMRARGEGKKGNDADDPPLPDGEERYKRETDDDEDKVCLLLDLLW